MLCLLTYDTWDNRSKLFEYTLEHDKNNWEFADGSPNKIEKFATQTALIETIVPKSKHYEEEEENAVTILRSDNDTNS